MRHAATEALAHLVHGYNKQKNQSIVTDPEII